MTKRDTKHVVTGAAVGLGLFFGVWLLLRQRQTIPVLSPAVMKWEAP